jgi:hypothetical protein
MLENSAWKRVSYHTTAKSTLHSSVYNGEPKVFCSLIFSMKKEIWSVYSDNTFRTADSPMVYNEHRSVKFMMQGWTWWLEQRRFRWIGWENAVCRVPGSLKTWIFLRQRDPWIKPGELQTGFTIWAKNSGWVRVKVSGKRGCSVGWYSERMNGDFFIWYGKY